MKTRRFANAFLSLFLTVSLLTISIPGVGYAQTSGKSAATASDLQSRLSEIEAKADKRRKELGIPGMSLAIVKDGKVVYSKGLGYKDFEKKVPMTSSTQLAIGSATKAFTGLSALILQDEGKLSLSDSPKKYLPYFKINNPETDKNIQVRDLMCHSSGLNRTDLAMMMGKLNREELIRVVGEAKPMAGLREKFYYQNIMFAAAGEIVAKVAGQPWEEFVPARIFAPLGMKNSTMSVKQMQSSNDYSFGYTYNFDTKKTKKLPTRNIVQIAPAGSINSSADDMATWIRFILGGGELDGKRLVSKKGFEEWVKPQMKITPNGKVSYGFGWFLQEWKGKRVVQHGGNIDGFNSMVAMIPEENIGFVMLTNVSASSLGGELMQMIWSGLLEERKSVEPLSQNAKKEVGIYRFPQAGFDVEVLIEEGKLVAKVPNQPTYILENVSGRKYKLSNAPAGFFITFKDSEAFLQQPQGNVTLKKVDLQSSANKNVGYSAKELIGKYESIQEKSRTIEIKNVGGKPSLVVGNQPPYALVSKSKDEFRLTNLPETYWLNATRSENGKISGLTLTQPEGKFRFKYVGKPSSTPKINISVDDLMAKTIAALGGEGNMRKLRTRVTKFELDAVNQGVKGYGVIYQKAPNKSTTKTILTALGKKIGWINEYFDGEKGLDEFSFSEPDEVTGKRLENAKVKNDFHSFLDLKAKLKNLAIVKMDKVGGEEVYVVSMEPKNATKYTMFISAKTFLPLRRTSVIVSSTSSRRIPTSEVYSDYRNVDGVMIPFKITNVNPGMGTIVGYVKDVKHNVKISDKKFRKKIKR